jgi:hypothetical protein
MHDLAGAHYSIETIALMKENLPFGSNTTNHQNVPQDRLIENLRGILAQKFKEGQKAAGVDKPHSIVAEKC